MIHSIGKMLAGKRLAIADVGATGGPEAHLRPLIPFSHFYTFDPDPRAKKWECETTHFPCGLYSKKCTKSLNLMAYPPATSLFEINHKVLSGFANDDCHKEVGQAEVMLDTLDNLLEGKPLDFIKIDTEGAELAILEGAFNQLQEHLLGVEVEVAFCERHKGAPLFSEVDEKLRGYGFELFHLTREHWLRKNRVLHLTSKPQLIWGNALYLLSEESLFTRLQKNNKELFIKYILLVASYGLYDYGYYLCEKAEGIIEQPVLERIKGELTPSFSLAKTLCKTLLSLAFGLCKCSLQWNPKKRERTKSHRKRIYRKIATLLLMHTRADYAFYD